MLGRGGRLPNFFFFCLNRMRPIQIPSSCSWPLSEPQYHTNTLPDSGELCSEQWLLEKLLAPRRSLGLPLLLYSFVEDTFTQERGSEKGYLLFFLYFSSCSIYLFNILDLDFHHRIDILSTMVSKQLLHIRPKYTTINRGFINTTTVTMSSQHVD